MSSAPTTAAGDAPKDEPQKPRRHFDPEDFRMSIGEHLDELRIRVFAARSASSSPA